VDAIFVSQSSHGNFTLPISLSPMGLGSLFEPGYPLRMTSAVVVVLPLLIFFLILARLLGRAARKRPGAGFSLMV